MVAATVPCQAMSGLFLKKTPQQIVVTNIITQVVTQQVEKVVFVESLQTNSVTGEVTQYKQPAVVVIDEILTNNVVDIRTAWHTNMAWSDTATETIRSTAAAASMAGVPFADVAGGAVVALGGVVFGWINRRRARKAMEEAGAQSSKASLAIDAVGTVVENFETLRQVALQVPQYRAIDDKVMEKVKLAQSAAGPFVAQVIRDQVYERTAETKPITVPAT
jgi:hypothetical protein